MDNPLKILIIRFSSIGDIVLTTPVMRCIKEQTGAEVHYLCKKDFVSHLNKNPHIDKIWSIESSVNEVVRDLQSEKFTHVLDLQNNVRSTRLKRQLASKTATLKKLNIKKWLFVNLGIDLLPDRHVVDRYMDTANILNVINDNNGLDYYIEFDDPSILPANDFIAAVIGGQHDGKRLPAYKWIDISNKLNKPIVLLGGKNDVATAQEIVASSDNAISMAGKISFEQSAFVIKKASAVISNDTGLMHVASAFKKDVISLWGQTSPRLGMYPYMAGEKSKIFEPSEKRRLSKLGNKKTRTHAMQSIDTKAIASYLNQL